MDTESQTRIDSGATDRELVQRMLAGDELAFDQFSESYVPALYRFALNRLSPDRELTREIVQATLCKAISKLDSFRGEEADAGELEMPSHRRPSTTSVALRRSSIQRQVRSRVANGSGQSMFLTTLKGRRDFLRLRSCRALPGHAPGNGLLAHDGCPTARAEALICRQ
ncbi:MAG: hypothetical protein WBO69_15360 [Thermoanaerobaculia bacterium]